MADALLVAALLLLIIAVPSMFMTTLGAMADSGDLPWLAILLLLLPAALLLGFVATVVRRRYRERIKRLTHLRHLGRSNGEDDEATQP